MVQSTIGEIARTSGFKGTPQHRISEPGPIQTLPVVDYSVPTKNNVRTSVDCYVSGQYVSRNGKMFEVTQRYTVFVSYANDTQALAMRELRGRVMGDFSARYGATFNVTSVYIPPMAAAPEMAPAQQMYGGSDMFKMMTRRERALYEMETERLKAQKNISNIRSRYRVKR